MTTVTRIGKSHWAERGLRIERARKFAGYKSQAALAETVSDMLGYDISRQVIYNIEQGERDIRGDELRAISAAVGQSEAWLDAVEGAEFDPSPAVNPRYVNLVGEWFERLIPDLPPPVTLKAA